MPPDLLIQFFFRPHTHNNECPYTDDHFNYHDQQFGLVVLWLWLKVIEFPEWVAEVKLHEEGDYTAEWTDEEFNEMDCSET